MHSKERNIVTRGYNEYYDKLKYAFRKKHHTIQTSKYNIIIMLIFLEAKDLCCNKVKVREIRDITLICKY